GEPERADGAAEKPSDVAADRDVRDREREDEVEDDHAERAAAEDVVAVHRLHHEARAEDAEDRPRPPARRPRPPHHEPAPRAPQSRREVDREEPPRPDPLLE